ncbi:MAG TPA: flagellar basal body P-ring formation chaperone FlgA [Pseudobdellovibrionaceae bacterium]|nr:flagellar basal body P-ring formation chaperone FlgA [Pseudobdellovibrionaceae bacterium]
MKLVIGILFSLMSSWSWARVEIKTLSSVEISPKDRVTLFDISDYKGGTEELNQILREVVLKNLGGDEASVVYISRKDILNEYKIALEKSTLLRELNPILNISEKVEVHFSSEVISKSELERNVLKKLYLNCLDCSYKIEITSLPQPLSPFWSINYDQLPEKGPFLLGIKDESRLLYISGKILVSKKIAVTKRPLSIGASIHESDLEEKLQDITQFRERPLDIKEIVGKKAAQIIGVNQPILFTNLQKEYFANRGQPIKAIFTDENLNISIQLQAEESGFLGDLIKIKNLETQKISLGKVIDKGVVEVQ